MINLPSRQTVEYTHCKVNLEFIVGDRSKSTVKARDNLKTVETLLENMEHKKKTFFIGGHANKPIDLTLREPITTAPDDKFCDNFPNFRIK